MKKKKVTKIFSWSLMKRDLRSNLALLIVCTMIMCMMSIVITYAGNLLGGDSEETDYTDAEQDFYSYLYVLAAYDRAADADLSYDDFEKTDDRSEYETAFTLMSQRTGTDYSVKGFQEAADALSGSDVSLDTYISEFEYIYALGRTKGVFSGDELDISDMMTDTLEMMGVSSDLVENMSNMDTGSMLNQMYYTIMIILPMLLFIIFAGNSLVVDQVDRGSMAYVLSTPTKRNAVAITQMLYMIFVPLIMVGIACCVRIAAFNAFAGEADIPQLLALYGGLYLLVEAMSGIVYFASCFFNLSKYAMALGGGLNIWFFLASLLGMFGSDNLVQMGMGVEELNRFNHLTLIGLFDIDNLATVGSGDVNYDFVWKLCVLAAVAIVCYIAGAIRFRRKDLPL